MSVLCTELMIVCASYCWLATSVFWCLVWSTLPKIYSKIA